MLLIKKGFCVVCLSGALLAPAVPSYADPAFGFGVSMTFGGGQVDTGVGLRVFSDDRRDTTVGSIGIDYMFRSKSLRGTVGIAHLKENMYIGLDLGLGFDDGEFDLGVGIGGVDTRDESGGNNNNNNNNGGEEPDEPPVVIDTTVPIDGPTDNPA